MNVICAHSFPDREGKLNTRVKKIKKNISNGSLIWIIFENLKTVKEVLALQEKEFRHSRAAPSKSYKKLPDNQKHTGVIM